MSFVKKSIRSLVLTLAIAATLTILSAGTPSLLPDELVDWAGPTTVFAGESSGSGG